MKRLLSFLKEHTNGVNSIKRSSLLLFLLLGTISIFAQVQVAFVGISNDSPDDFSFVAVTDIPANTSIYFTDEEYRTACSGFHFDNTCAGQGEDYLVYTSPGSVVGSGTVVVVQETASNVLEVISGPGTIARGGLASYSQSSSDIMHAFLASNAANPFGSITEVLASFNVNTFDGSITFGDNPIGQHSNAIVLEDTGGALSENSDYKVALRSMPTTIANLIDPANYTTSTNNLVLSTTNFTEIIASALPVELTAFTGRTVGKQNILEWTAISEVAFSHYELERSSDGAANWAFLGAVAGAEQVGQAQAYSYSEVASPSSAYYRLRMVDLDGSFTYSNIVHLQQTTAAGELAVYPNPNDGQFTVQLPTDESATLALYDLTGKVVWQRKASSANVSVASLPEGVYLLSATTASNRWTKRIVVR